MAIRWNATTKKWVLSTGAVVGATLLILSLCKSCDAQDNAKEAKQTAVETKYKADSVAGQVDSLEESTEQSLAEMGQDIKELDGRLDTLTEKFEEHSDSTFVQGVHQGRSTKTSTRTTTGTTTRTTTTTTTGTTTGTKTGTAGKRVDTTSMSTVGVVTYGDVNVGDGSHIVVATGNAHVIEKGGASSRSTTTTTGTTTGTTEERVDTTSMSTVGVVTYGNVNVGDGTNIVVATGNAHVEQTVLPDDYVEVRVTYRETVVRDPKAWKKYARRCRGR